MVPKIGRTGAAPRALTPWTGAARLPREELGWPPKSPCPRGASIMEIAILKKGTQLAPFIPLGRNLGGFDPPPPTRYNPRLFCGPTGRPSELQQCMP